MVVPQRLLPLVLPHAPSLSPEQTRKRRLAGLFEWARLDSNQGPTDYESAALTS
jgi:hypothetical protein